MPLTLMPGKGDVAPVHSNLQTVRTPRMVLNKQTHLVAQMSLFDDKLLCA